MKLNIINQNTDKLKIILKGDEHIGSKYFDKDFHQSWLEWIMENDCLVIGMGDNLETATKDSIGAGVFEQDKILQNQYEEYLRLHKPLADAGKLLGLHIGNHEARVYKHSGLNITKNLARELGIKYFGLGVAHYIKVGKENYTLYTTHGHSGARLPHTKIKTCIDLANMIDVEIYGMGHLHQLSHHTRQFYKINKRKKIVEENSKHFILTGSYLTHWGSYAQEAGYEMSRKGSPTIKLSGDTHKIRVGL